MSVKENYILTEYTMTAGLPKSLTLGFLADLHEQEPGEALRLLRMKKPDLILVAGDTFERHEMGHDPRDKSDYGIMARVARRVFITLDDLMELVLGEREHDSEYAYQFFREAGKIAPVFLSLGNHEWYLLPEDLKNIREAGVRLLDNSDCKISLKGMQIRIGGLSSAADLEWLEEYCRKDGYKILLCHHPEYYERYLKGKEIHLILSGHAHGGQIRIGNRGLYSPGQGLFPEYTKGIYDDKLVVTTGCSNTTSVPRLGNPCEVVSIRLE